MEPSEFIEEYLSHHGVLGMKWGVRRGSSDSSGSSSKKERRLAKADAKFKKKAGSRKVYVDIGNKATDHFYANVGKINAKYPGSLRGKENKSKADAYFKEIDKLSQESMRVAAHSVKSPSGKLQYHVVQTKPGFAIGVRRGNTIIVAREVKHAESDDFIPTFAVEYMFDNQGKVTGVKIKFDNSMAQAENFVENFLKHT